jgi:hypothetical protein
MFSAAGFVTICYAPVYSITKTGQEAGRLALWPLLFTLSCNIRHTGSSPAHQGYVLCKPRRKPGAGCTGFSALHHPPAWCGAICPPPGPPWTGSLTPTCCVNPELCKATSRCSCSSMRVHRRPGGYRRAPGPLLSTADTLCSAWCSIPGALCSVLSIWGAHQHWCPILCSAHYVPRSTRPLKDSLLPSIAPVTCTALALAGGGRSFHLAESCGRVRRKHQLVACCLSSSGYNVP